MYAACIRRHVQLDNRPLDRSLKRLLERLLKRSLERWLRPPYIQTAVKRSNDVRFGRCLLLPDRTNVYLSDLATKHM
jgi:hypothetical protein